MKVSKIDSLKFSLATFIAFFLVSISWNFFGYLFSDQGLQIKTLEIWMILGRSLRFAMIFYVLCWTYNYMLKK